MNLRRMLAQNEKKNISGAQLGFRYLKNSYEHGIRKLNESETKMLAQNEKKRSN